MFSVTTSITTDGWMCSITGIRNAPSAVQNFRPFLGFPLDGARQLLRSYSQPDVSPTCSLHTGSFSPLLYFPGFLMRENMY